MLAYGVASTTRCAIGAAVKLRRLGSSPPRSSGRWCRARLAVVVKAQDEQQDKSNDADVSSSVSEGASTYTTTTTAPGSNWDASVWKGKLIAALEGSDGDTADEQVQAALTSLAPLCEPDQASKPDMMSGRWICLSRPDFPDCLGHTVWKGCGKLEPS